MNCYKTAIDLCSDCIVFMVHVAPVCMKDVTIAIDFDMQLGKSIWIVQGLEFKH